MNTNIRHFQVKYEAGNISPATEAGIKAKARAALGGGKKKTTAPKAKSRAGVDHMAETNRHDAMVDAHRGKGNNIVDTTGYFLL